MSIIKNNLSPLPFFTSLEDRDKWYGYGHKQPLIAPNGFLPFILRRDAEPSEFPKDISESYEEVFRSSIIDNRGTLIDTQGQEPNTTVYLYTGMGKCTKAAISTLIPSSVSAHAVGFEDAGIAIGRGDNYAVTPFEQEVEIPEEGANMYVAKGNNTDDTPPSVVGIYPEKTKWQLSARYEDNTVTHLSTDCLDIVTIGGYDYIYTRETPNWTWKNGSCFLIFTDGTNSFFSAWISPCGADKCLEIKWSNNDALDLGDFYIPADFQGKLVFDSELCYPEYIYEDEVISRDGYEYPTKSISYKKYKFLVLGQEEICDVMRLIHLSDNVEITSQGKEFDATSFNMSVEWLEGGFLAKIHCDFTTDTVVKKLAKRI